MTNSRTTSRFSQVWRTIGYFTFIFACASCSSNTPKPLPETEGNLLFGDTKGATNDTTNFWTICLKPLTGPDARLRAQQELERLSRLPGLDSAFILERADRVIICIGQVASPTSAEAESLLARVRALREQGVRPFPTAFFIPPTGGATSDLDLRSAPATYGESALYTLQVGAYGRADGKPPTEKDVAEARQKAEQAASQLRQQGELAFYYHGPSMSMVTVGVFGTRDIGESFSTDLRALMERFPHNLYNGQGINQTFINADGREETRLQDSFPVLIPSQ